MSKLETRIISSEHCFFDYFPVAFRFEDLCLCESHARQVMEALESNLTPRAADGAWWCGCNRLHSQNEETCVVCGSPRR